MPTIAKTKRYRELTYRYLKLIQLYAVMSELRLHTNKAISVQASKYYHDKLYTWGDFGPFLTASLESMMQVFYIELDGFVGAYWDSKQKCVKLRKYDQGSLSEYLYDGTRKIRKKTATDAFESLLQQGAEQLYMIHEARGKLAHFKKLDERSEAFVPNDIKTREILNKLAETLYLLGFQQWNKPHYIERDNDASESTQKLIDKLLLPDSKATAIRKTYLQGRAEWFGGHVLDLP